MVNRRSNSDIYFKTIFEESKKLMGKLDVELKLPRITKYQIHSQILYLFLLKNTLEFLLIILCMIMYLMI